SLRTLCFVAPMTAVLANAADVSVRVDDAHRGAVPAAAVTLISRSGERRTLTTGPEGILRFNGIGGGEYFGQAETARIDISAPRMIDLKGHAEVAIPLGVAQVQSSVVVTASGAAQTTDEVSKALTVVSGETIELRAEKSMAEALDEIPGLRVQQLGGPGSTT